MNHMYAEGDEARRLSILGLLQEEKIAVKFQLDQELAHAYFREHYPDFYGDSIYSSHLRDKQDLINPSVAIDQIDERAKTITFTKLQHKPTDGYMPNSFEPDMVVKGVVIPLDLIKDITLHSGLFHKK